MQPKPLPFNKLINIPITIYKTIGGDLYEYRSYNNLSRWLLKSLLYIGFINLNFIVLGGAVAVVRALKSFDTILAATGAAPCIGFSLVANFKQIALVTNRQTMRKHLDELEEIFPKTYALQVEYKLAQRERVMQRIMIIFTVTGLVHLPTFFFYPVSKSALQYWLFGAPVFEHKFGFLTWYPNDKIENIWMYWLTYWGQVHSAYLSGVAFVAADLVLVSSVTQLCMHFDYLSRCLEDFRGGTRESVNADMKYLQDLIMKHAKCLELSEQINSIFGFSLLLNLLTTSFIICFVGFQLTATEDIGKYCIFFCNSLMQVLVVCYYGDELMTASSRIGDAAYNQNWFDCDRRYKRLLTILIMRSQKPASIRPPTLPPLSFRTYMKVIGMSYQFFALLRTTYKRNGN